MKFEILRRIALCLIAGTLLVIPETGRAQPAVSKEYQIKAAFLFHFVEFAEWPPSAFPETDTPIRIGVLGDDPFGSALDATVRGETIRNRQLVVQRSRQLDELKTCQIVFVSKSERGRVPDILARLEGKNVLTVSDIEGFAHRGGVINFYLEGNKTRFEVNPESARQQNLKLSSQLLSLGKITARPEEGKK